MKKLLLLFIAAFSFYVPETVANNISGSSITYTSIGPNMYLAVYKVYRNCQFSLSAPNSVSMQVQAPGCDSASNVTLHRNAQTTADPYCSTITNQCNTSSGRITHTVNVYSALFTLPGPCPNWIISVRENGRISSKNLDTTGVMAFTEAMLNNRDAPTNSSPAFVEEVMPYLSAHKNYKIVYQAHELDGDSVAYSLAPALTGHQDTIGYRPSAGFSASNSFGSFSSPGITLDSITGMVQVSPNSVSGAAIISGNDNYATVVQAEDYRKINNQWVKVGHVRYDVTFTVLSDMNSLPYFDQVTLNGNPVNNLRELEIEAGQTFTLQATARDAELNWPLTIDTDFAVFKPQQVSAGPPDYQFHVTPGLQPTATLTWTPVLQNVSDKPFYFNLKVMDNDCELRGYYYETIGLRVKAPGAISGLKENLAKKYQLPTLLNTNLNDRLQLHSELSGATVNIYNHTGSLVKSFSNYDNSWSANSVAAGLYIYSVEHKWLSQPITSKLLVVK